MYRRASRAMLHASQVDAPFPTGGYVGETSQTEDDFITSAGNMSMEECAAEMAQLGLEVTKGQAELAKAKRDRVPYREISDLNHRIQVLGHRKSLVKKRYHALKDAGRERRMCDAVKALCDADLAARIFAYANGETDTL
jgi:hypothetical protein